MTLVNCDDDVYKLIAKFVEKNRLDYPSITNFVSVACRDKLRIEMLNQKEREK